RAALEGLTVAEVGVPQPTPPPQPRRARWLAATQLRDATASLLRFWWSRVAFPASDAGSPKGGLWEPLAILALVTGLLLFANLGYPLLEPDEGRYAEIARKMLVSGDWVVPTLNRRPFFDKPPLFYWLVAGSFSLFGTSAWAARLVSALAAFLTVQATFL